MLKALKEGITQLIFPPKCTCCKIPVPEGKIVCQNCLASVEKIAPPFCKTCGKGISAEKTICRQCEKLNSCVDQTWSICKYSGMIKECLHLFKYAGKKKLNKIFKKLMRDFSLNYHLPFDIIDCVIPVPLHKSRLREREFNQASILASNIAHEFDIDLETQLLKRVRNTKSQANLSKLSRESNLKGAFALNEKFNIEAKNFLIVDDIYTTGITIKEIASKLKSGGAEKVFALTMAR